MDHDMYRIKVLKYINPHLIWVEVISNSEEIVFEQIGIYGILPLDTILDVEGKFRTKRSEAWMPAASVVMSNILADAEEILFYPIHKDRRSSIFNNNIHKYGDIVVKKVDGKEKHVSKQLKKSGFAVCDIPQFHEALSRGIICTKLTETQAIEVVTHLKECYINKHRKMPWEEWVKTQTYIYNVMQKIDILTELNRHMGDPKKSQISQLKEIQTKLNDLNLCSEIDEESVGRGIVRSSSSDYSPTPSKSKLLKWKVRMAEEKSKYVDDSSSTEPELEFNLAKNTHNMFLNSSANSDTSLDESLAEIEVSYMKNNKAETIKNFGKKYEILNDNIDEISQVPVKAQKTDPSITMRMAYGPPGLNRKSMPVKNLPRLPEITKKPNIEPVEETKNNIEKGYMDIMEDVTGAINNVIKISPKVKSPPSNSQSKTNMSKTLLLQRKLKQHKEKLTNKLGSFTSDINNFEEPIQNKVNTDSSDDESISGIIEKLNLYTSTKHIPKKEVDTQNTLGSETPKINVNPFRNIDGSNSVFVDKLISTVLMVHTKKNNRIQPCSNIRDVPFTKDIHVVLRNMGVKVPTRIQTVSWTTILRGHSLFMIGPLGCGKTMGYLPAVCRLTTDSRKQNPDNVYPSCIIVCATAKSVSEVEKYSKMFFGLDERVLACYAGMDELSMTTSLLNGCDLLVCTPPILARLLQTELGVDLRSLNAFVIDDCERISEVYGDEIKFALYEVKKVLKNRANKEMKVQFVVASRVWCKFLESLVKKAPDSVVCIGSFQECVLYSKTRTVVDFVKKVNKTNVVLEFLEQVKGPKRTIIVCRYDDEVDLLEKILTKSNRVVFACNNSMTIHDLYNLNIAWGSYEEPTMGPILICCDSNLTHLNITDAHYLLHYSMPSLFSTFSKRFSVLNDNYPSIFKEDGQDLKVKILLQETNSEQLPKILNFVKRCTDNVPDSLDDVVNKVLANRDVKKSKELVPVCDTLLSFGHCVDFWNCKSRHAIIKEYDAPKEWMPVDGNIHFKILHYHTADLYSVRLMSNTVRGNTKKYPQMYNTLYIKMGMYFSKESNRRLHGTPRVGDVCAVSVKLNFFARCQVVKILDSYKNGNPNHVLVRLIDEERYERSKDVHLYYLSDELKEYQTYVVQVRLANIRPLDKDVTYSDLAKNKLKKITDTDEDLYLRADVVLAVGNCVFVDSLEACQSLSSLSGTLVRYNFRQELLNGHAELNLDHIPTLQKLCQDFKPKQETTAETEVSKPLNILPKCRWAHLDSEDLSSVFLASAENPDKFFVRLAKFRDCMNILIKDINAYVKENPEPIKTVSKGDIVLAEFPDDSMYERARIDDVYDGKVRCFFVDQGDWREVTTKHLIPITAKFITQMPFQAIECRLIGVRPAGEDWTEFCTYWFTDYCFEDSRGNIKQLYLKYFDKTEAEYTNGHKYGVAIIDTNSEEDVIVNHLIVDLNLAKVNEEEIKYLENLKLGTSRVLSDLESDADDIKSAVTPFQKVTKVPLGSFPLVDSDNESDDIDKWAFNMDDDFMSMVKPNLALKSPIRGNESTADKSTENLYDSSEESVDNSMAIVSLSNLSMAREGIDAGGTHIEKQDNNIANNEPKSVADSELAANKATSIPNENSIFDNFDDTQFRKPKLTWYQNKNSVIVKIHLIGADNYIIDIKERYLKFLAEQNDTKYGFQLELYGVLDLSNSNHSNKGQYILVKLIKMMNRNWLTLTRDGNVRKWLVYDIDRIDTSSCDEDTDNSGMLDAIKHIHHNAESDTDDEDFADDVTYMNPKYS